MHETQYRPVLMYAAGKRADKDRAYSDGWQQSGTANRAAQHLKVLLTG